MSWRDYQERRRRGSRKISGLHVGTLVLLLGLVGWILLRPKSEPVVVSDTPAPKADSGDLNRGSVGHLIETADLSEGPGEIHVMYGNAALVADLTFDEGLQRFILKELRRRKVDWAGVAVVDALTGEVLALASHSEREPSARNLALRATFSAASVFKVVTAAAAVEDRGYRRSTLVRYEGNSTKVRSREILHDRGRESMTLAEGFAKSANAIFGKIGARAVGGGLLSEYAERFGFNTPIPFIPAVELSRAEIPREDPMEEARAAAGFGEVTLSPLHGALIAGAVVADGFMMEPFLVRRIVASTGRLRYATGPRVWRKPITPTTAKELRKMMIQTVADGTARKGFRGRERDKILRLLEVGGKTGSLTGKNPRGKHEWFIGYAQSPNRRVAIGMVIVSETKWKVRPSELAKEIFHYYFSPRLVMEANAQPPLYGP